MSFVRPLLHGIQDRMMQKITFEDSAGMIATLRFGLRGLLKKDELELRTLPARDLRMLIRLGHNLIHTIEEEYTRRYEEGTI